jgi:AhpD family alkylhydroperoxidase
LCETKRPDRLIKRKQVSKVKGWSRPLLLALVVHMKTSMSRFQIHDDLTAPEGSVPVLRGALASGGQLPNFLGVLAGSPAALRAYARFRSELRHGKLTLATLERIALAVAEHYGSEPGIEMHSRAARGAGLQLDEVAAARQFSSKDPREAALLSYLQALVEGGGRPPMHLHEEAREAGWEDEQILEAIAAVSLEGFTAMINVAGEIPVDGSTEASRALKAA